MLALCHEWIGQRTGSEKTFEAMAEAAPTADLYALTWDRESGVDLGGRAPITTFLDKPPFDRWGRQVQLPLMPMAWRYASRQRYDVVVTSSHACAKGFWPGRDALHLSYCYTPMRYVWLPEVDARTRPSPWTAAPRRLMRRWDRRSVGWVEELAAISEAVRARIERFYDRPATVIHPPVDTDFFTPDEFVASKDDYVLAVSRLVRYKRIDLAVRAAHALRRPLVVAGSGPEEPALRALVEELGADVRFEISPGDETLRDLYRRAQALVFPAFEDFGIVAVEAQACGTPVVGIAAGGSLDTVVPGVTGALVADADTDGLGDGLAEVLRAPPCPVRCREHALRFSRQRFIEKFRDWVLTNASRRGIDVSACFEPSGPGERTDLSACPDLDDRPAEHGRDVA